MAKLKSKNWKKQRNQSLVGLTPVLLIEEMFIPILMPKRSCRIIRSSSAHHKINLPMIQN
jgi:hypothetical protein